MEIIRTVVAELEHKTVIGPAQARVCDRGGVASFEASRTEYKYDTHEQTSCTSENGGAAARGRLRIYEEEGGYYA